MTGAWWAQDKSWTTSSWHVFPLMPRWSTEVAHAVRTWQVRPKGAKGLGLLRSLGCAAYNTTGSKGYGDRSGGQEGGVQASDIEFGHSRLVVGRLRMQDSCSMSVLPSGWSVFCLFDGHGDGGHWPALRASRTLPYFLQATWQTLAWRVLGVDVL